VVGLLEAAHLRPYRGVGDNHPSNGLLLRSDLHTLFDLDMLGIEPDTLRVVLRSDLKGTEYEMYDGKPLLISTAVDATALRFRWSNFLRACEGVTTVAIERQVPAHDALRY
jgi:putative restriction endonuclease